MITIPTMTVSELLVQGGANQNPPHQWVHGDRTDHERGVGSNARTKPPHKPSRMVGRWQSWRRRCRPSPVWLRHRVCTSRPKARRGGLCLSCHGGQEEKCKVSPNNKGSCILAGQAGRAPRGSSKTKSIILKSLLRQYWVNKCGHTTTWLRWGRLMQERPNSSKIAGAVAGARSHKNHRCHDSCGSQTSSVLVGEASSRP